MRLFACPSCSNLVFFDNCSCLRCGAALGFDPWTGSMRAPGDEGLHGCREGDPACNWLLASGDPGPCCLACRTTVVHPTTGGADLRRWQALERAKRRLLHTLLRLGLPLDGMTFAFPADGLTGHEDGLITVVLAEADDVERAKRQAQMGEAFRTLIGHFRHESGHHFHTRLVLNGPWRDAVRGAFGDEREDYQAALERHYREGPRPGWETSCISAYAASHPHEDWAETWAHYLHLVDAVEIAAAYGLSLAPDPAHPVSLAGGVPLDFDGLLAAWYPLTWFANSLNRSIGLQDWYPFAPSPAVIAKLRLVHDVVRSAAPASAMAVTTASVQGAGQSGGFQAQTLGISGAR